ncbi:MAG TPA: hypothetical protein P5120_18675 [Spirochaetota bacterium]|nr:hypothetical protein [Spirochaetota bacterium]HPJ44144.1 hypothetical protein [Spirochaetota bacterium]HPR39362.1 hypothetical protein [Spirochaetota bacterium]HRX49555.1 hypothetical protein [Spirochaetota bacterium]
MPENRIEKTDTQDDLDNLNELVPLRYRERLNSQPVKIRNNAKYYPDGTIFEPYIFVIGLGERHFRVFDKEIQKITDEFPWMQKKFIRFIMNELISNTQFSMLRQIVHNVDENKKSAGYFNVIIYPCGQFFSAAIEEFGDFFDYFKYLDTLADLDYNNPDHYDSIDETVLTDRDLLNDNQVKLILDHDSNLKLADSSNRIGLNVIEQATDQDFYITSFYKNGKYMWKRIYFRIEND